MNILDEVDDRSGNNVEELRNHITDSGKVRRVNVRTRVCPDAKSQKVPGFIGQMLVL
jgi:hypothetical protein